MLFGHLYDKPLARLIKGKKGDREYADGQSLRLHAPNAGELDSILGQGTKSHMSQLKKKVQHATVNPEHQINKCIIF